MLGKYNVALELAKKILREKLACLEEVPTVGDSQHESIEYITRIEDHPDGHMQFLVKYWIEVSEEPSRTEIMGFHQLQSAIASICSLSSDAYDFVKNLPKVKLKQATKDSEEIL